MKKKDKTKSSHLILKIILAVATCKLIIFAYNFIQKNYKISECKNEFEKVDLIIKYGNKKEINKQSSTGETQLWWACYNNNFELAKYLIEHGAAESINCADDYGDTPLWWACFRNNLTLVKYLIENGAIKSINTIGDYGFTPVDWACKNNYTQLAEYLIKNGAIISNQNNYTDTITNNLSNNYKNNCPTLYCACCNGNLKIVKYLVKNSARKQAKNLQENTIIIAKNIFPFTQKLQDKINTEKFFMSLYYACLENNTKLINFILFGQDKNFIVTNQENKNLLPSLYFASISHNTKITKYLIENYLD